LRPLASAAYPEMNSTMNTTSIYESRVSKLGVTIMMVSSTITPPIAVPTIRRIILRSDAP
jgi:hypothetical protein